jgi:hypothetical protein
MSNRWKCAPVAGIVASVCGCLGAWLPLASSGHGTEGRYLEILNWKKPNVARTFGSNRAHLDGISNTSNPVQARVIAGQGCVVGDLLLFDVDNTFAFDIDETVTLTLTYASDYSSPFIVAWDRNGGTGQGRSEEIVPAPAAGMQKQKFVLERARFAGQATQGADIAIGTRSGVAICDIALERTHSTPLPVAFGEALLTIKDGPTGRRVPARVGIYDATGRAPLRRPRCSRRIPDSSPGSRSFQPMLPVAIDPSSPHRRTVD